MTSQRAVRVYCSRPSSLVRRALFNVLEFAAGPSLDDVAVAKATINVDGRASSASLSSGSGTRYGGHVRAAFYIGGLSGSEPVRSGLVIVVDARPLTLSTGRAMSLKAGLGVEWY